MTSRHEFSPNLYLMGSVCTTSKTRSLRQESIETDNAAVRSVLCLVGTGPTPIGTLGEVPVVPLRHRR
jgi:hypothetical protein